MQKPEEPAATIKAQTNMVEEALGTAMGSPVVAVPAPEDVQPQQSQLSASSSTADECSLGHNMDQETEVCATPSCVLIYSRLAANAS